MSCKTMTRERWEQIDKAIRWRETSQEPLDAEIACRVVLECLSCIEPVENKKTHPHCACKECRDQDYENPLGRKVDAP